MSTPKTQPNEQMQVLSSAKLHAVAKRKSYFFPEVFFLYSPFALEIDYETLVVTIERESYTFSNDDSTFSKIVRTHSIALEFSLSPLTRSSFRTQACLTYLTVSSTGVSSTLVHFSARSKEQSLTSFISRLIPPLLYRTA